ncbi:MAG: tetratricopeptide repeat protein [Chloroflexia bacterium]
MELTLIAIIGAVLLLLGLGVLVYDTVRRKQSSNPFPYPDQTTHNLDETALQAHIQSLQSPPPQQTPNKRSISLPPSFLRLYSAAVQAGGNQLNKLRQVRPLPRSSRPMPDPQADPFTRFAALIPRRALAMIITGSVALILLSVTILVTGAAGPPRPPGTVIAIANFANAPSAQPLVALSDYIAQSASSSNLNQVTVRSSLATPLTRSQAESERVKIGADILIWGDFGPQSAITANIALSPDFSPATPPWQAYDDPDPTLLSLPTQATIYLPAGRGLDPIVPLSLALLRWRVGDFAGAADAAWGSQATLDENGGSSEARFPAVVRVYSLLALGRYADTAQEVTDIEQANAGSPAAYLARAAARLLAQDYSGASDDANQVISDRDASSQQLARAYIVRARSRYSIGNPTDALLDIDEAARLDPTIQRIRLDRAETYYRQAQPTLANDELTALLRSTPNAAPAYRLLGLVRLMQAQPEGALDPLGKARDLYTRWIDAQRKDEAQAESLKDTASAHAASDNIVTLNKRLAGIALYQGMAYADITRREPPESWLATLWRGIRGEQSNAERAVTFMAEAARLDPRRPDVPLQLGSFYTTLGRYDEAEQQLRLALDLDPTSSETYMSLAHLQETAGRPADAIATLESFLTKTPRYYPAYEYLFSLYTAANNPNAAQSTLERAFAVTPFEPADHLWRGKFLIKLNREDDAIAELVAATANPELWEAHLLLGNIYSARGHGPDALTEYQAVLAKQANQETALLGAGRLLVLAGKGDEAQTLFERLTSVAPNNVDGHIALLELLLAKGETDRAIAEGEKAITVGSNRDDAYFFLGTAYEAKHDLAKAANAYKTAAERNPQNFQAFLNWARSLYYEDLYSASIDVSNQAIALRPSDPQPYRWRAASQLALGDANAALSSLGESLNLGPGNPFALALTARAYAAKGDEQSAIDYATQSLKSGAQDPVGQLALGDIHLAWGRANEAIQAFGTASEIADDNYHAALALTGEARSYQLANDTDHALYYFGEAIKRDPTAGEPHLYLGSLYAGASNVDNALREYRSAVTVRPNWPLALYYLGQAYLAKRDLTNAAAAFTRAVQFSPAMFEAWFGLGLANRDGNHPQEAIRAFTQAATLKPDYAEAWLYLGLTFEEAGDRPQAANAFTHARDTATTDAIKAQANEGLARVQ